MLRAAAVFLLVLVSAQPAAAQDTELGQMRLYAQQLEERVRQLTGQNEQLLFELNRMRAAAGQPPFSTAVAPAASTASTGQVVTSQPVAGTPVAGDPFGGTGPVAGALPQDPGSFSIAADDPLIAPDGAGGPGEPMDLSTLAGGGGGGDPAAGASGTAPPATGADQTAAVSGNTAAGTALSGTSRDEYDLAYGYVLTGDYALAEKSFQNWLSAFPNDPQAGDARFWLAESHLQQGEYREAASGFLAVYKAAPDSTKAPDALLKLGASLSALGEKNAACATLAEVGRKYPQASAALMERVDHEVEQAGC